jgi:hypothetical protein
MRCDSLLVGCIVYLQSRCAVAYEQRIIVDGQSVDDDQRVIAGI